MELPNIPCIFDLNRRTGELKPKNNNVFFQNNQYSTTIALIGKTIEHLNLNCDRLNQKRKTVLWNYEGEIKKARLNNDRQIHSKLAQRWFGKQWLPFFTTRRILLGKHAEQYL